MFLIEISKLNWQGLTKGSWKHTFSSSLYFVTKKGLYRIRLGVKSILQSIWHFLFGGNDDISIKILYDNLSMATLYLFFI